MHETLGRRVLYVLLLLLSLVPAFVNPYEIEIGVGGSLLSLGLVLYFIHGDRRRDGERERGFPLDPGNQNAEVNRRSIEILDAWEAVDATDDPQEIARRQEEFEQIKAELNATRRATDGTDARVPYP